MTKTAVQVQTKAPTIRTISIKDNVSTIGHGILLLNQETLQEIYENSGPNAVINEFQAHYWALVFRHIGNDGAILDIAIPTVFFNYLQTVSTAHIDFDMKNVRTMSKKLKPVHTIQVTKLLKTNIQEKLEQLFKCKFEPVSVNLCNIHRHPGSSSYQSFSGTDLDKNSEEHGIVYPFKKASYTPSFASIMAIDNGICNLAHSEYRLATGKLGKDITYVQNRSCAIAIRKPKFSSIEKLLGRKEETIVNIKEKNSIITDYYTVNLINILKELPKPVTSFVLPTNVIKQEYKSYIPFKSNKVLHNKHYPKLKDVKRYSEKELYNKTRQELILLAVEIDNYYDLSPVDYSNISKQELINSILEGYAEIDLDLIEQAKQIKEDDMEDLFDYSDNLNESWISNLYKY